MVNYNTKELKVALFDSLTPEELSPLSEESIDNVLAAIDDAFDRNSNTTLVFVLGRHILPTSVGHRIHRVVTNRSAQIVAYVPTLIILTLYGKTITVHFIGGIGTFYVPAPKPDSSSEESDADSFANSPVPQRRRTDTGNTRNSGRGIMRPNRPHIPNTTPITTNRPSNNRSTTNTRIPPKNNAQDSDSSFEDTIGLTQELY